MRNKLSDVKDHLVAMLEQLGDEKVSAEVVERAKATSLVAGTYISALKTELDALRLADEIGVLPSSVEAGAEVRQLDGPRRSRPRLVSG